MQERIPKDNREDLEVIEVVSLVNGSGSADGYHRVVVEEKAKCRVCGLHERALNLATHDGHIPQIPSPSPAPLPIQPKIPPSCRKKFSIALL
jgi:hypothetical protein